MKRREFLKMTSLTLASLPLVNCSLNPNNKKLKNIVVIIADDHANRAIGCFGGKEVRTPNLDKMAKNGMTFTNAYTNSPVCSASRQSLLTGKYPHAVGVNLIFTPFNDTKNYTIAEHLKSKGYATGLVGKTHWNNWIWWKYYNDGGGFPTFGFDYIIDEGDHKKNQKTNPPKQVPDEIRTHDQITDKKSVNYIWNSEYLPQKEYYKDSEGKFFIDKAIEFMKSNKDNPFFLWLAFHEPHSPFKFPVEYRDKYKLSDIKLPKGSPEDDRHIPEVFRDLSEEEKKNIIASYYSSVEYLDHSIGYVLEEIKNLNLDKNTMVIYISDHGYLLYDHKRFEKHTMWEEAVKSPIIVQGFGKNVKSDALIEFIDVAPSICDAIGVKSPKSFTGQSFVPILSGESEKGKDYIFSEFLEDNLAMVASEEWKYVFTTGKRDLGLQYKTGYGPLGVTERLYDLINDPKEKHDVASKNEKQLSLMRNKMLEIFTNTHPEASDCPWQLNIIGKLIWFCEPRDVGAEPGLPLQRIFDNE